MRTVGSNFMFGRPHRADFHAPVRMHPLNPDPCGRHTCKWMAHKLREGYTLNKLRDNLWST